MRTAIAAVLLGFSLNVAAVAAPRGCTAGIPLTGFRLMVESGGGGPALPIRSVNRIQPGQKLAFTPLDVRPDQRKSARVAVILAPSEAGAPLAVLEPKPAAARAEWTVPAQADAVALVFGPQGLDHKKVSSLVKKDRELVAQLADYAEKTSQTEALIEALIAWDSAPNSTQNVDAALRGFSARYGLAMPRLDRNAPPDQQAAVLLRAVNPALTAYDPLAADPSARMQQSAGLAASVAGLFLGNTVGLAAGGASIFVNMRSVLFPNTDFRSALAQGTAPDSVTLCARREASKPRTRMAYLWAVRVPDAAAPQVTLTVQHLPLGVKSAVPARLVDPAGWRLLDRAREWKLVSGNDSYPVTVRPAPESQSLEVDLGGFGGAPGVYRLAGQWDWQPFEVAGELHLHALPDLREVRLAPSSQDRLVAGAGRVEVELEGADLQFLERVALGTDGEVQQPSVAFRLPEGPRKGPQARLNLTVNVAELKPGQYYFVLTHPDGASRELPFRVLPPHPRVDGLPLRVNLGEHQQQVRLRGVGLDRVERLETSGAVIEAGASSAGELVATVRLHPDVGKGQRLDLMMSVEGVREPVQLREAVEIAGMRPRVRGARGSLPGNLGVELRDGELPAGLAASFSIEAGPLETPPVLELRCAEDSATLRAVRLRSGEEREGAALRTVGQEAFFLSVDPGAVGRPGCVLTAVVETDAQGRSDPFVLGKVVRLPRIESFTLTDERLGDTAYAGLVKGEGLETIERAGWERQQGLAVQSLPTAVPGEPGKQTLKIPLPWPSPAPRSPLYVWLRGEPEGRKTDARY